MLAASMLLLFEQTQPRPRPARWGGGAAVGMGGGGATPYFGYETNPDAIPHPDRSISSRRAALLAQRLLSAQRARRQIEQAMAMGMLYGAALERMAAQEAAAAVAQREAAVAALEAHEAASQDVADSDWLKRATWIAELELDLNEGAMNALANARPVVSVARRPIHRRPWFKWVVIGGLVLGIWLVAREGQAKRRLSGRRSARRIIGA